MTILDIIDLEEWQENVNFYRISNKLNSIDERTYQITGIIKIVLQNSITLFGIKHANFAKDFVTFL